MEDALGAGPACYPPGPWVAGPSTLKELLTQLEEQDNDTMSSNSSTAFVTVNEIKLAELI